MNSEGVRPPILFLFKTVLATCGSSRLHTDLRMGFSSLRKVATGILIEIVFYEGGSQGQAGTRHGVCAMFPPADDHSPR